MLTSTLDIALKKYDTNIYRYEVPKGLGIIHLRNRDNKSLCKARVKGARSKGKSNHIINFIHNNIPVSLKKDRLELIYTKGFVGIHKKKESTKNNNLKQIKRSSYIFFGIFIFKLERCSENIFILILIII